MPEQAGRKEENEPTPDWVVRYEAAEDRIREVRDELFREHVRAAGMAGARRFRRRYGKRQRSRSRASKKFYPILIEQREDLFFAHSPDLPGCVGTGRTFREAEADITRVIREHVARLRRARLPIPAPRTRLTYVDVVA